MCSLFLHFLNDSIENFNESNINNVNTHQKSIKNLELRPLWYIENNDVIGVKTRMTLTKKCFTNVLTWLQGKNQVRHINKVWPEIHIVVLYVPFLVSVSVPFHFLCV